MGPLVITVTVEVIAQIPRDIRERSEARNRVANEPVFVLAAGSRMNAAIVHIEHHRNNQVPFTRITKHSLKFLAIVDIETRIIKARVRKYAGVVEPLMHNVARRASWPGCRKNGPVR